MHVRSQPGVVGQVPSIVVGIEIDHDVIVVPQPVGTGIVVVWRGLEKESAHVEAITIASVQPPDVLRPNRPREASMLPGMIKVVVDVVSTCVVSYPAISLGVNVGRRWMPWLVLKCPMLVAARRLMLWRFRRWSARRRWPMLRNVATANSFLVSAVLLCLARVRWLWPLGFSLRSGSRMLLSLRKSHDARC
jgi:hypothetical protein